jgi:hypothetical protein
MIKGGISILLWNSDGMDWGLTVAIGKVLAALIMYEFLAYN